MAGFLHSGGAAIAPDPTGVKVVVHQGFRLLVSRTGHSVLIDVRDPRPVGIYPCAFCRTAPEVPHANIAA
eukprot:15441615-Alexandrium_andersonii.AAC.1